MLPESEPIDILMFAEDPGAANYVIPLYFDLQKSDLEVKVLAAGIAKEYFRGRSIPFESAQKRDGAECILESLAPRVLVAGTAENLDTFGLDLIAVAKRKGIITVGVIDAFMNAAFRFSGKTGDPRAFAPDWVLVPDERVAREFVELGYDRNRVLACGHPHYDYYAEKRMLLDRQGEEEVRNRLFPNVEPSRRIVVFACEGSARVSPVAKEEFSEYAFLGSGKVRGRTEIVIEEFLDVLKTIGPRPYLVLRLHPKDCVEDYAGYLDEFDFVSQGGEASELIYASDLVLGMTSMLLQEAVILGRPVLSIIPRAKEMEWLPPLGSGMIVHATSRSMIRERLGDMLGIHANQGEIRFEYISGASERSSAFIRSLISGAVSEEGSS